MTFGPSKQWLASQEIAAPPLTENDAVSMALRANRDIQSSALSILRANAGVREARTNFDGQKRQKVIDLVKTRRPKGHNLPSSCG